MDVRRRGAGRRRGRPRRAIRRAGRPTARQHARRAGDGACPQRLHRQRAQMPATGQPHAGARRGRRLPPVSRSAGCADTTEADRGTRAERRDDAARRRCDDREPARPRASLPRSAADRHLPSGIPAAQLARQSQGMGRSVPRAGDTARSARRRLAKRNAGPQLKVDGRLAQVAPRRTHEYSGREMTMRKHSGLAAAIFAAAFASVILSGCGYNDLQRQDEQVKSAWSEVVNQYQRRADLVPNLVNTVKGYAAQEQQVLTEVTNARAQVGSIRATPELINDPVAFQKFIQAQNQLQGALSRLLAVSENYPQLKSDALFRDLQSQLEGTENRIAVARNRYIKSVQEFNTTVRQFPTNLTAMIFKMNVKPNFAVADESAVSAPPKVDFGKPPAPGAAPAPVPGTAPAPAPAPKS